MKKSNKKTTVKEVKEEVKEVKEVKEEVKEVKEEAKKQLICKQSFILGRKVIPIGALISDDILRKNPNIKRFLKYKK